MKNKRLFVSALQYLMLFILKTLLSLALLFPLLRFFETHFKSSRDPLKRRDPQFEKPSKGFQSLGSHLKIK